MNNNDDVMLIKYICNDVFNYRKSGDVVTRLFQQINRVSSSNGNISLRSIFNSCNCYLFICGIIEPTISEGNT